MILSSSTPNPVRPIGSAVNLTCIVHMELGSAIDVPVILTMDWTGPDGFTVTNISQPILPGNSITYTSRVVINSLGRNQSGVYKCTAVFANSSTDPYLIKSVATSNSIRVTTGEIFMLINFCLLNFGNNNNYYHFTGVHLALRNQFISNNTQVNIRSIGLSSDSPNGALQCITDKNPCCFSSPHRRGEWYLPNRMLVLYQASQLNVGFYRSRGDNGRVYLNRLTSNNITQSPNGRFCCEVPDATDTNQILCVVIGQLNN